MLISGPRVHGLSQTGECLPLLSIADASEEEEMSSFRRATTACLVAIVGLGVSITGCENLPGGEREQGAVLGGAGGAATGAVIAGEDNRLTGALIGGLLGAGGGYLIGREMEDDEVDVEEARAANAEAQTDPAAPEDALEARTADLNGDGFVTLDEVVAMADAGLTNEQMIDRLEATGQVFVLTESQKQFLWERGVDREVISAMGRMNQQTPAATEDEEPDQIIGED